MIFIIVTSFATKIVGKHRYSVSASVNIGFWSSAGAIHRIFLFGSMVFSASSVFTLGAFGCSSFVISSSELSMLFSDFLFSYCCSVFSDMDLFW